MSGKLNEPGTVHVEWLTPVADPTDYSVVSGPWVYAEWLCWRPTSDPALTQYAPLANIATWCKTVTTTSPEGES